MSKIMRKMPDMIGLMLSLWGVAAGAGERFCLDMVYPNPGEGKTASSFLDPWKLARWGYTGQVSPNYIESTVMYDTFDPAIFPEESAGRAWAVEHAGEIDQQIAAAHAAGIAFYAFTDFIVLPKSLVEKYKNEILTKDRIDLHRPMTQKILRAMMDEIFTRYPTLDGLMVRWGETYLVDVPFHTGGNPIVRGAESQVELIQLLREEVCEKRGKMMFYRTWGAHFHTEPEFYLAVTDRIEPHPKLVFSIKYAKGDFHRMQLFNPTLGIGKHRQIVEVQCQPEAYGKGACPYYIAGGVIDGWEEFSYLGEANVRRCFYDNRGGKGSPGVTEKEIVQMRVRNLREFSQDERFAGVWTWSRGGGWQGPYIKNELWCELNVWVVGQWAQRPGQATGELRDQFARDRLGLQGEDLSRFAKLCDLSAAAALRGHMSLVANIEAWWTRDHWIGGVDQLKEDIERIIDEGKAEAFLAEKAQASAMWREIERLAGELSIQDEKTQEFFVSSCAYGRILYGIFEQAWTVMLLGRELDRGMQVDTKRITQAIADHDKLWERWRILEKQSPSCATIYKDFYPRYEKGVGMFPTDSGLGATVNQYRRLIEKP
jgi:hypothetical protein